MAVHSHAVPFTNRFAKSGDRSGLLRFALRFDALVSGANGVVYLAAAGPLAAGLGVSEPVLRGLGAFLVLYAVVLMMVAARRPAPAAIAVRAIIAANVLWAVDSIVVLALGWAEPTVVGGAWFVAQAFSVAGFAALQAYALRAVRATVASSRADGGPAASHA